MIILTATQQGIDIRGQSQRYAMISCIGLVMNLSIVLNRIAEVDCAEMTKRYRMLLIGGDNIILNAMAKAFLTVDCTEVKYLKRMQCNRT